MLLKQSQVLTNLASLDEEESARAESATLRWQVSCFGSHYTYCFSFLIGVLVLKLSCLACAVRLLCSCCAHAGSIPSSCCAHAVLKAGLTLASPSDSCLYEAHCLIYLINTTRYVDHATMAIALCRKLRSKQHICCSSSTSTSRCSSSFLVT